MEKLIWKKINSPDEVFIIAEIGKNFIQEEEILPIEVYSKRAKQLIKAAKEAGADAVKFQTHEIEDEQLDANIISPHFNNQDRYNWVKRNTLITPLEFWKELKGYSEELGIIFFSTPMSKLAAKKLESIGVHLWKIGSADILDFLTLDHIAKTGKPIIISSGMSRINEIDKSIEFLKKRTDKIVLLHCVSKYPCPSEDLNLHTIKFFQKRYKLPVGFSDHSLGYESAIAAVNMGAKVIEKHFSFDRNFWGPDHKVSMTPEEFKIMVDKIRKKERIDLTNYGREAKILNSAEKVFREIFRKSLVAGRDIKKGERLEIDDIYSIRPQKYAKGLPSDELEKIIGKKLKKDLNKYDPITLDSIENGRKRKICFVITSKIHYARNKLILEELRKREDVDLQIVLGGSAILEKYGNILNLLEEDGFNYNAKIIMTLEGGVPAAMAKTTGIGIVEFTTTFENLKSDLVVVRGDRYEVLSAAIASAYLNIPIAHIEGGDVSGTIDESVRHAITKLSHIHFTTNELSKKRVLQMGENPKYVFNYGSPDVEFASKNNHKISNDLINYFGVGSRIDINKPFIMVSQHPVTTEFGKNREIIMKTLEAIEELDIPTIWFWPNIDAGTDEVSKGIRTFREEGRGEKIRFIKFLPPEDYIALLKKASVLVGNSSAGIKECSFLGIPVVNIGSRQNGRMRGENVLDADYDKNQIKLAIKKQLNHGKFEPSYIYYTEDTSKNIANKLVTINLYIQKKFYNN